MCLFTARAPCKTTPAPHIISPTSTNHKTMDKKPSFWKFKVTYLGLLLPFLYVGLIWLLVPQACASPYLSSCPLDPSVNPYRMLLHEKEKACFFNCFKITVYIMIIPILVFALVFVLQDFLSRKKINARNATQNEMAQTLSRLKREINTILEMHERTYITA